MGFLSTGRIGEPEKKPVPSQPEHKIVVGLDVGTSKICALIVAEDDVHSNLNVLGVGLSDSEGINRGAIASVSKSVASMKKAIEMAELQSGTKVDEVIVGIAGDHIESTPAHGVVSISNPNKEVTQADVDRVIEESKNIKLPIERKIIHTIPQEFIIDGQDGITDPLGMVGVRMEANTYIVTGLDTAIQNMYRCVEQLGIKVRDVVLEPLASSYSVLDAEEMEVGVALIDIGGGTTDIAIFEENIIRYTSVFAIAGKQITDDVRKGLGIIASQAERIKREYGHCHYPSIMNDEVFMIPGIGGRKPMETSKSMLCQMIQPRVEEIFEFARAEIRKSGYAGRLGAGVVITGGCSLLGGIEELAGEVFGMPVKIGIPSINSFSGFAPEVQNPMYSTAVGLALYGLENKTGKPREEIVNLTSPAEGDEDKDPKSGILTKLKDFIKEI